MATVEFRVAPDAHIVVDGDAVPRLHHPGVRGGLPGQPLRARRPTAASSSTTSSASSAARATSSATPPGAITWTLPRGRPRRRVPAVMTPTRCWLARVCLKWVDLRPEVDPLTGAVTTTHAAAGAVRRRPRPRSSGRCGPPRRGAARSLAVTRGPAGRRRGAARGARRRGRTGRARRPAGRRAQHRRGRGASATCAHRPAAPRVVLCDAYSLDRGSGSVPAFLAAHLGAAQALGLVAVEAPGGRHRSPRWSPPARRRPPGAAPRGGRRRCCRSRGARPACAGHPWPRSCAASRPPSR